MSAKCGLLLTLATMAALSGCAMCQNCFDYCSPVMTERGQNCDFGARYGSAFHPQGGSPPTVPLEPRRAQEPVKPKPAEPDSYEGARPSAADEEFTP